LKHPKFVTVFLFLFLISAHNSFPLGQTRAFLSIFPAAVRPTRPSLLRSAQQTTQRRRTSSLRPRNKKVYSQKTCHHHPSRPSAIRPELILWPNSGPLSFLPPLDLSAATAGHSHVPVGRRSTPPRPRNRAAMWPPPLPLLQPVRPLRSPPKMVEAIEAEHHHHRLAASPAAPLLPTPIIPPKGSPDHAAPQLPLLL
jgi:hypothetical protein